MIKLWVGRRYEIDATYAGFLSYCLRAWRLAGAGSIRPRWKWSLTRNSKRPRAVSGRFGRREAKFTRNAGGNLSATGSCPSFGKRVTNSHSVRCFEPNKPRPGDYFPDARQLLETGPISLQSR